VQRLCVPQAAPVGLSLVLTHGCSPICASPASSHAAAQCKALQHVYSIFVVLFVWEVCVPQVAPIGLRLVHVTMPMDAAPYCVRSASAHAAWGAQHGLCRVLDMLHATANEEGPGKGGQTG
jgi:hypothetical protein